MSNKEIPSTVKKAFPLISNSTFVRRLASPVPLVPDTTFDVYTNESKDFIALVTTDYVSPRHQSEELKSISGQYEFEFTDLVKPFSKKGDVVEVPKIDDVDSIFFVTTPYKNHQRYYYVANLKQSS